MNDVYALVRSLRDKQWPRNRFFEAHATPSGAEARRLHRFLRAVERDVRGADRVTVRSRDGGGVTLELAFEAVRLTRIVSLTPEEHALLSEDPSLAERLRPPAE